MSVFVVADDVVDDFLAHVPMAVGDGDAVEWTVDATMTLETNTNHHRSAQGLHTTSRRETERDPIDATYATAERREGTRCEREYESNSDSDRKK